MATQSQQGPASNNYSMVEDAKLIIVGFQGICCMSELHKYSDTPPHIQQTPVACDGHDSQPNE